MKLDSPFFTYTEQIEDLKSKNVIINDKKSAFEILSTISYYTLINGYKNSNLMKNGKFIDGIHIEMLYEFYLFDLKIQSILFKYITIIETTLKTKVSYEVSKNFGEYAKYNDFNDSYLSTKLYNNSKDKILLKLNSYMKNPKNNPLKHYCKDKNHIPPWVLVKNIYFTDIISWYNILPKNKNGEEIKIKIIKEFNILNNINNEDKKNIFISNLKIINQYRNAISHNNKSININLKKKIDNRILKKIIGKDIFEKNEYNIFMQNGIFPVFIAIILSLPNVKNIKNNFFAEIVFLLESFRQKNISLYKILHFITNLPLGFLEKLEKITYLK